MRGSGFSMLAILASIIALGMVIGHIAQRFL
jgi:hypothetical protein